MKVLFITNMYPVEDYIYFGIHVKEQIDAISNYASIEKEVYFINGRENKWNYFHSIKKIKALIQTGNFDLVHIHYGLSGLFLLFNKINIPVVITLHSGELYQKKGYLNHLMQKTITLSILKSTSKVIVLNDDMISLLKAHSSKLVKLPCGTDLALFKEIPLKKNAQKITIGFPGNKARKEKNYTLFNEIIIKLKQEFEINVIEFHNLSREDVVKSLNEIDLLLMTSLVEGSPQIIKEAMACNKPIISTQVGDLADVLSNVENSFIIDSFNAEEFLGPVRKILSLPTALRHSPGRQKLVSMGLDAQQVAANVYKLYTEVL
jgi:teichuronic acid biosynthesis glycosyltransferase TuaC